jgi:hypothetical protein
VYAPADVFGSNFRDDDKFGPAEHTVGSQDGTLAPIPENLPYEIAGSAEAVNWWEMLALTGIRAHSMYWETDVNAETAFSEMIGRVFQDTPVLRPASPAG